MGRRRPNWADVAESYEDWYETARGRRYDALEKALLAPLLSPWRGGRLLDIGCGTGHFSRWFRELGWEVWGLDLEERMLARARELSEDDIVYSRADAAELPFADKSFHLSVMITTLETTSCPEVVLREAMRVSREKVILGVLNSFSLLALFRRIRTVLRPTIFSRTRFYSGPALCSMIRRVSRQLGIPVSVRIAPWMRGAFPHIPLGPFFALAIELEN